VHIKLLVAPLLITIGIGVALVLARQAHINIRSEQVLQAGLTAFEQEDWLAAVKHLRRYLIRNQDNVEILRKYATACLAVRPLGAAEIAGATSAYRRVVELDSLDHVAYERLADLYTGVGNFQSLERIARMRLEYAPEDAKATLWLADALIQQKKRGEAKEALRSLIERLEAKGDMNVEYVRACMRMSNLVTAEQSAKREVGRGDRGPDKVESKGGDEQVEGVKTPLKWLDRAVAHAPDSAEALAYRAQFYREKAQDPNGNTQERQAFTTLGRADLEAASAIGTDDPGLCCLLADEWIAHRQFDRAEAQLQKMEKLPQERVEEHFFDESDWTVAKFLLAAKLAMRKGASAEAVPLADRTLASLQSEYHRAQVLPFAVPLYAAAGRTSNASAALDEYFALVPKLGIEIEPRRIAWLKGLVEGAANRPYAVINTLESVVGDDASSAGQLRLLARAYAETGQTARAIEALTKYLKLYPNDAQAMLELAKLYSVQGDWSKASEIAQMAESTNATDPLLKLLRIGAGMSSIIARGQNIDAARLREFSNELAQMKKQYPERVDIRLFRAVLASLLEQPEEAERELRLAIEECQEPLRAEMQLVRHYLSAQRTAEAIDVCRTACERHSEVAVPWMTLADLHVAADDIEAARVGLDRALNTISDGRQKRLIAIKLAVLELTRGNRPTGIKLLKDLSGKDGQDVQVRLLLLGTPEIRADPNAVQELVTRLRKAEGEAGLWWRLHQASLWLASSTWSSRQAEIVKLLQHCIDTDVTWSAPVLLLAGMYERMGEPQRVENLYRQGLLSNPSAIELADRLLTLLESQRRFVDAEWILRQISGNPRAQYWRPRVFEGMGDFSRAIDEYRLKVSNDRQDAASRIQLARLLYQETKDVDQALKYLKEAEAIAPDARTLIAVKASILKGEGKAAEAMQVLDGYVAAQKKSDAYWIRAVYLAEQGDLERAEADYRKLTTFAENGGAGYELLGNFYAGVGRLDQGITAVEEGLVAYPKNLRLKRQLMQLLFQRTQGGDRDRAIAILTELLNLLPADPELMTIWAVEKILREPAPKALASVRETLQGAVRRAPRYTRAWLALIEVSMRLGDHQAAAQQAVQALEANPNNTALLLARAKVELVLGYGQTAFNLAREALRDDPNNVDSFMTLADGALVSRNTSLLEQARTLFDEAIHRLPGNERLLISRAQIYTRLERPELAIPELEAYCQTQLGSGSVEALVTLVDLYRIAGQMPQAEKTFLRAEQLAPHRQVVVHARLLLRVAQKRLADLVSISQAYIQAEQQNLATSGRAASILWSLDSPELKQEGSKLLEYNVTKWPESLEARLALAMAHYSMGQIERAKQLYEELLEQFPQNVDVLNDLAWILQQYSQDYERALELANRGVRLVPNDENLLDTRATIFAKMPGRLAEAKRDFDTLRRLCLLDPERRPRLAKTLLKLARVCVAQGEIGEAKMHATAASEINAKIHVFTTEEHAEMSDILKMESVAHQPAGRPGGGH
jgi:tetratricopeptide (TPR) repeat protein